MSITASQVKELRDRTGAGFMECKKALSESGGDLEKAMEELRKSGVASAAKKAGRAANEGLVWSYIHPGGRVGVLLEVNCETDFVAKTDDFQNMLKDISMHIAASDPSPIGVRREDIPEELIEKEKKFLTEQARESGKPEAVIEKMIVGRMEKFFAERVLLEQPFVRDDKKTVGTLVTEAVAKLGENIVVRRFARFQLGVD
ncbi:MAG: translation elongation factor Ts [Gemmatimonadetes bacterium]|nr:translation elongation factor Ts [Gemmatimonadota bacterium]